MEIKIEYEDNATPFLQMVLRENPQWMSSALKSTGYWAQKEIKAGIRSGTPGGRKYADLTPLWMRRKLDKAFSHRVKRNYKPLGQLVQAVEYDGKKASKGLVTVGWFSRSAVHLGSKHEKGFFTEINEKMRQTFKISGIKLPEEKRQISVIARPTFKPMKPIIDLGAPAHFQNKLIDYLQGASERSKAASRRRYGAYR